MILKHRDQSFLDKECNNILHEWQLTFVNNLKKSHYFLMFEDEDQQVIKLIYAKGGSWLPIIEFTNSLCARFTHMTTGHAERGKRGFNCDKQE